MKIALNRLHSHLSDQVGTEFLDSEQKNMYKCDGIHRKQTLLAGVIIEHMANNSDNQDFWILAFLEYFNIKLSPWKLLSHYSMQKDTFEGGFVALSNRHNEKKGRKHVRTFDLRCILIFEGIFLNIYIPRNPHTEVGKIIITSTIFNRFQRFLQF